MTELALGITLKADGSGLVGEVRLSRQELDKLKKATGAAGRAAAGAGREMGQAGRATDRLGRLTRRLRGQQENLAKGFEQTRRRATAVRLAIVALAAVGVGRLAKSFVDAASEVENYALRLEIMLGDQREANRLFEELRVFAGEVPFQLREIIGTSTQLATVIKTGVDDILLWTRITADLAATAGLSMEQAGEQMARALSAGIGSADLFRERGVSAFLGFQQGVSI